MSAAGRRIRSPLQPRHSSPARLCSPGWRWLCRCAATPCSSSCGACCVPAGQHRGVAARAALSASRWRWLPRLPSIPSTSRRIERFDSRDWVNYPVTAMYIAIGVLVGGILEVTRNRAARSETARSELAEEQAALRRVATLIAQGAPPRGRVRGGGCRDARPRRGRCDADHSPRTRTVPRPWSAEPGPTTGRARSGEPSLDSRPRRCSGRVGPLGSTTTAESPRKWRPVGSVPLPPSDRRSPAR